MVKFQEFLPMTNNKSLSNRIRIRSQRAIVILLSFLLITCNNRSRLFDKIEPSNSGIEFKNSLRSTQDFNIIDYTYFYNGGGVAIGDINGDGLIDLFFSGNQVKNQLYLNKGNLEFENITENAGVSGNNSWDTGSVMGDVNGDGLLDIYVCAVVGLKGLKGHNELFINNGDNTFSERSHEYGLDFESFSSTAAFLDYDQDDDLDIFLMNHAVHTPESFGHASLRNVRAYETGGKLLRNDSNRFVDVSEEANIYGGINGYGLGVGISDFNLDGYPDIYVSNDFHEDDYLYINNKDGTFREQGKQAFTCTSKFSMGNDIADVNHDGYPDVITLDMLPEEEEILKRSVDEENVSIMKLRTEQYGYNYQFPRNMLQINLGNGRFAEVALMSGVASTDWSWSALFADFDQDGNQDLFVSNGIPKRPNDLDYLKYVSSDQVINVIGTTKLVDEKALTMMPSGLAHNYIFKGSGNYGFKDMSSSWLPEELTSSTAAAMGDLDNDGDLDLVVNNIDELASIYINQTDNSASFLKINLRYNKPNLYGIGTKVYSYSGGVLQFKELYSSRGFQSSSDPAIYLGFGKSTHVDSIKVIWPNGKIQLIKNIETNQSIVITYDQNRINANSPVIKTQSLLFERIDPKEIGLDFVHEEDRYTDFDRIKLLPYQQSDRGPATAVGDINNDGLVDVYFGGSKHIPGEFYLQKNNGFVKLDIPAILQDSIKEDVEAIMEDLNNDGKTDLFIGSGGADFYYNSKPLLDSYYVANDTSFSATEIENYYENASCVKPYDFDKDGDIDLFVGNGSVSKDFGKIPKSYLLINDHGNFNAIQRELFDELGMVTDAVWDDYNKDGLIDLIVVGEWMEPVFLKNIGRSFERDACLEKKLGGLWQMIVPFDIEEDGTTEYILGNWGLNSKYKASGSNPLRMYYYDFDKNDEAETIIALEKNGAYYPLDGFDMLASQIPNLRSRYSTYQSFAGQTIEQIFENDKLEKSVVFEVQELASGYLRKKNGKYDFVSFPMEMQISPIMAQIKYDFDLDGKEEVLVGGNYFGVQPFHGRFGSFEGAIIKSDGKILGGNSLGLDLVNLSVRHFSLISLGSKVFLLVTINNGKAQLYNINKK